MAMHTLDGLVERVALHTELTADDARALRDLPFTTTRRDQHTYITREGETVEHCYAVLSGLVERHRLDSDGGKQILAFYLAGDPINLDHLFLDQSDDDLRTLRSCELACIRLADLRRAMAARPSLGVAVLRAFAVDASIFREWTVNVGQRHAEQRIGHLLCELEVRARRGEPGGDGPGLPVSQYNIAEATGLTPVHVNRTLKMMQAKGLLTANRSGIRVHRWDDLRENSGFHYRYLHMLTLRDHS